LVQGKIRFLMLSRRSLRIKVMQVLYTFEQDREIPFPSLQKQLDKSIDGFYPMYVFSLWLVVNICRQVNKDAAVKAGKFIKLKEDENYSVRLFHNPIIQKLVLQKDLFAVVEKEKLNLRFDQDLFRFYFDELKKIKRYKAYAALEEPTLEDDKAILSILIKNVLWQHEEFHSTMEDLFPSWNDDEDTVAFNLIQLVETFDDQEEQPLKKIKNDYSQEKKFAGELLQKCFYEMSDLENEIEPKLKNWDKERVARIDHLLLVMAVAELLYINNIPVKVTLNEYIEIAKQYSTPQSGQFINGILDSLVKDYTAAGRMHKSGRGTIDH